MRRWSCPPALQQTTKDWWSQNRGGVCSSQSVRNNSPAAINNSADRATSAPTSQPPMRVLNNLLPRLRDPARRAVCASVRAINNAGSRADKTVVTVAIRARRSKTLQRISIDSARRNRSRR